MQLSKFEVEWQPERCLPDLERNLTFNIFNTFTDINFSYIYIHINRMSRCNNKIKINNMKNLLDLDYMALQQAKIFNIYHIV